MSGNKIKKDDSIITMSEFFNKFNAKHKLFADKSVTKSRAGESNLNRIPYEILLKIFKYLNAADLIKCSHVCKDWHKASHDNTLWVEMGTSYQCIKELDLIVSDSKEKSYIKAFKSLYCQKRDLKLFKLSEKLNKKVNNYTGLPDLKAFLNDFENLDWCMEFYDKKENLLLSIKATEINNFEAGYSVIWSSLNELGKLYYEAQKIKIFASIPVYMDLKNGKLSTKKENRLYYNINSNKMLVKELDIHFVDFHSKNKNLVIDKIYENSIINMFCVNKDIIIAFWTNTKNELAFISFNSIFDFNLVEKIFGSANNKNKNKQVKSSKSEIKYNRDLELDSKLGLHDYKVYMCIRNQTKTTFLSISQNVFKASIKKYKNQEFIHLNVIDCDMINYMGPQLTMLPKFTWKTEVFKKNNVELLAIADLCIFDSNNKQFLSNTFALNFIKGNKENSNPEDLFISSESFWTEFKDDDFIVELNFTTLKDEFTFNSSSSHHLNKMDIYLNLDLVDSWFGTSFNQNQKTKKSNF